MNLAGAKRHAPATLRNRAPILTVLREALPASGIVVEVASGSGEHAVWFARHLPALIWQPSDPDPDARASIEARRLEEGSANLRAPLALEVEARAWPIERADAIVCINMVHISPWFATEGLMAGASRLLAPGAPLVLYGPYVRPGFTTSESNLEFDKSLKARNLKWGLRDLEAVTAEAESNGLALERIVEMPANNLSVIFRGKGLPKRSADNTA